VLLTSVVAGSDAAVAGPGDQVEGWAADGPYVPIAGLSDGSAYVGTYTGIGKLLP